MNDRHAGCSHDWGQCNVEDARSSSRESKGWLWFLVAFWIVCGLIWLGRQQGDQVRFDGGGATVTCNDGWVSHSPGEQGACSWHGGVR